MSPAAKSLLHEKIDKFQTSWQLNFGYFSFETGKRGGWEELGEGGFSRVYKEKLDQRERKGQPRSTIIDVAVKELKVKEADLDSFQPQFLREVHEFIQYAHPCVLKTYEAIWAESDDASGGYGHNPMIVTERMTCDLFPVVQERLLALNDMVVRKSVSLNVATALAHLRENGVVHRDVKPENVLIQIEGSRLVKPAKLSNFGVSREVQTMKQTETYAMKSTKGAASGTVLYMPPEALKDQQKADP